MSYITLDTGFYRHPKVLALGNSVLARTARDLYVGSLLYCREHLTDGFVPMQALADIDPITSNKDVERAALALHSVGLFYRKRGRFTGYWIKDYADHQQTKEEVEKAKAAAKERKRKQRERLAEPGVSRRDIIVGHGVTPTLVTPIEVEQKENKKNPTEPVADISGGKTQDLEAFKAAARLYELIPESDRDVGTERIVLGAAREGRTKADFDEIYDSLQRKMAEDGLFKGAGAYVNGALRKAARKAA